MEVLLMKISALHAVNKEIIAHVEALDEVHRYDYFAFHHNNKDSHEQGFVVEEVRETTKVAVMLKEFKFTPQLMTNIWDMFNDKPNWEATSWDDLKRLNDELLAIVDKFALLKDSAKVSTELAKYLHNLEIIQTSLGEVEEKTLSEQSRRDQLAACVAEVNCLLDALKLDGVKFSAPPPSTFGGGSIVSREQAQQLIEWYGRGWELLYKASRDGWASSDFHSRCDNKGPTVMVVRCTDGHVFGGHLAASWNSSGKYIACSNALLFTLSNLHEIPPTRLPLLNALKNARYAAQGKPSYSPTFGNDLYIAANAHASTASSFDCDLYVDTMGEGELLFTGDETFQAAEVEVFAFPK